LKKTALIWIKAGHHEFAKNGPEAIKIDSLAKSVGKSRSSFYHCFGDLEEFEEALIEYQISLCQKLAEDQKDIEEFFPVYMELMTENKDLVFFNKQLFIRQQDNPHYASTLKKTLGVVEDKISELWLKMVDLDSLPPHKAEQFYLLIRSAALARLSYESFTYDHLYKLIHDINSSFGFLQSTD